MTKFGIDFGTTNSSISLNTEGRVALLDIDKSASNQSVVRSALYFYPRNLIISNKVTPMQKALNEFNADQIWYEGEEKKLIGSSAINQYLLDNNNRKPGTKRKIFTGKMIEYILYTTPSGKTVKEKAREYYEETDYGTGRLLHALKTALKSPLYKGTRVFGNFYTLEQLISMFVSEMTVKSEQITGEKIEEIVCGRPVKFSSDFEKDKQAQDRLEEALKLAGIKKIAFEYEPVAAAKYFVHTHQKKRGKILVFDFGGGTLDTTIVDFNDGFKVLATDGVYIGGDLLNSIIMQEVLGPYFGTKITFGDKSLPIPSVFIEALNSWYAIPNLNSREELNTLLKVRYRCSDLPALERLEYLIRMNLGFEIYEAIEIAKKQLTTNDSAKIIYKDGPINLDVSITRNEFEKLIAPKIIQIKETIFRTLKTANLEPDEINFVVRTGGSSLIPMVENMLIEIFGKEKVELFDTFTSIASGLSL